MPITSSTSSPPDSGFTPRKEFIRDQQQPPNTFAILALSGANFIRLYSFTPNVVSGLQSLFERSKISIAVREDQPQGLYELSIDHKPWANPKSVFSERLLVDILGVIYRAGYNFLSSIDYGREADDKLAVAFSKPPSMTTPSSLGSKGGSPLIPSASPAVLSESGSSAPEKVAPKRTPFALSFASTTLMRVISPPLHLTPAILQAVRGAWPRGVVSEKKVGDNCFEFKQESGFQQDNFAFDSLQHILTLLASLDAQSFTLLTSLSLTSRSRVKDLWIFTGPAPEGEDLQREGSLTHGVSIPKSSLEVPHQHTGGHSPGFQHRRLASDVSLPTQVAVSHHSRSATEDLGRRRQESHSPSSLPASPLPHPGLLRKPAPRAQVPVSVIQESDVDEDEHYGAYTGNRADLPSMISSTVQNMTGVGARGQGMEAAASFGSLTGASTSPGGPIQSPYAAPALPGSPPRALSPGGSSVRSTSDGANTPPARSGSSPHWYRQSPNGNGGELNSSRPSTPPQPLLSPGTFRDSGLSDVSHEIPIRWTGVPKEAVPGLTRLAGGSLTTPKVHGGWRPGPIDEGKEGAPRAHPRPESPQARTPIHAMLSRVESPEVVRPEIDLRKSEAVVYGMIHATSLAPPPVPSFPVSSPLSPPAPQTERMPSKSSSKLTKEGPSEGGQGWVLVNVEGAASGPPAPEGIAGSSSRLGGSREGPRSPMPQSARMPSTPSANRTPLPRDEPSPAAKAIAVVDAIDSRQKNSRAAAENKEMAEGGGGVRRFFSLNRKNSRRVRNVEGGKPEKKGRERALSESNPGTGPRRATIRDRLRLGGTPEAVRREDKPRNMD